MIIINWVGCVARGSKEMNVGVRRLQGEETMDHFKLLAPELFFFLILAQPVYKM